MCGFAGLAKLMEVGEGSGTNDGDAKLEFVLPSTGVSVGLIFKANFVGLTDLGFHEAEKQSELIPSLDVGVGLTSEADLRADGGFVVVPPVMGLLMSFSVLEFSEKLWRQQSLGPNCFSLLSELGYDSNDAVAPRQFWEDPLLIEKGQETCSLVVEPLALWYPNGGLDFGTMVSVY